MISRYCVDLEQIFCTWYILVQTIRKYSEKRNQLDFTSGYQHQIGFFRSLTSLCERSACSCFCSHSTWQLDENIWKFTMHPSSTPNCYSPHWWTQRSVKKTSCWIPHSEISTFEKKMELKIIKFPSLGFPVFKPTDIKKNTSSCKSCTSLSELWTDTCRNQFPFGGKYNNYI